MSQIQPLSPKFCQSFAKIGQNLAKIFEDSEIFYATDLYFFI